MKWLLARKNKWLFLTLIILTIVTTSGIWFSRSEGASKTLSSKVELQLGFYDLMSQRKEIYNSRMQTVDGILFATITSPDDPQFILKGKFNKIKEIKDKTYFYYTPVYYNSTQRGLMIDGLVDLLMNMNVWLQPLSGLPQPVVIGQSGALFIYPLNK